MKQHTCRTYFHIVGIFDVQAVSDKLHVTADRVVRRGEPVASGRRIADRDSIDIGLNDDYNVDVNEMLRVTLKDLKDKTALLAELKKAYGLEYYLEIVPEIEQGSEEPQPILSLDDDIIEFLYLTKTKHDLDYYVC